MEKDGGIATKAGTAHSLQTEKSSNQPPAAEGRLVSLDFFRGVTMFMLIGESTGLYERLRDPALKGTLLGALGWQLEHHPWNGLHCWDLFRPFLMFIVGLAMPFPSANAGSEEIVGARPFTMRSAVPRCSCSSAGRSIASARD